LGAEKKKERKIIWNNFKKYTVDKLQFKVGHGFSLSDELIKIPLWINNLENNNKFVSKIVNKNINCQIDIFPTLLDILNIPTPEGIDGISLFSVHQHKAIYLEECIPFKPDVNQVLKGVRTERYKYICRPFLGIKQEELYDLYNDPFEKNNISIGSNNHTILNNLREALMTFCNESTQDFLNGFLDMPEDEKGLIVSQLRHLGYF
jgi:arylsulfatase A-like enzyme